jgi:hypothetical protein
MAIILNPNIFTKAKTQNSILTAVPGFNLRMICLPASFNK